MAYQTTTLKFSQLKIYVNNKQISFEAKNQINRKWNNHELPGSNKKENWVSFYIEKDPSPMFTSFLCTFFNIFQASFPVRYKSTKDKNDWTTQGIKIFCKHERSLYAFAKNSNGPKAKAHYIIYCKVLKESYKRNKEATLQ